MADNGDHDPKIMNNEKNGILVHYKRTSCRILYSTQSGRARACARRASRILQQQTDIIVTNRKGATFDEEIGSRLLLQDFCQELKKEQEESSSTTFLLLFVSTTRDGEHTDTIQQTWQQLRQKSLPVELFQGIVTFAIFNLGDRAYGPQFCAAGRKLAIRLLQLGATLLCEPGYGDDGTPGGGVFADLDVWLHEQLLTTLLSTTTTTSTPIQPSSSNSSSTSSSSSSSSSSPPLPQVILPYKVTIVDAKNGNDDENVHLQEEEWQEERFASSYQAFFARLAPYNAYAYHHHHHHHQALLEENGNFQNRATTSHTIIDNDEGMKKKKKKKKSSRPLLARVVENRRITAPDWEQQDTRHVRLVLVDSTITTRHDDVPTTTLLLPYQAGDVASVMPSNSVSNVERFLAVLPVAVQELANVELEIQYTACTSTTTTTSATSTTLGIYGYDGWPEHCTLRGWLTFCADLHALPDREDVYALSHYCSPTHDMGREQCQKLQSLSEASGASLYNDYILREKRSWADVLYDFDSLRAAGSLLTIPALLALLSPIRPREFSIASSPTLEYERRIVKQQQQQQQRDDATEVATSHHDSQQEQYHGFGIDLCVAVVQGTTARGRKYHGLCSHYISKLHTTNEGQQQQQSVVRMWIRPGSFIRLPLQTKVDSDSEGTHRFVQPVLYIGAGTGVAPLRGLIQERQAHLNQVDGSSCAIIDGVVEPTAAADNQHAAADDEDDDCWKMYDILLFGCRQEKSDYYYQSEWQKLQARGRLHLMTAFSQDQWHKIYVQQVLRKSDPTGKKLAAHLLKKAGCIYIAGGPKMASAVKEEIVELLTQQMGGVGNEKKAQQLLVRLQRAGRFSVEAWS